MIKAEAKWELEHLPEDINHPTNIVGTTRMVRLFHCLYMYDLGNSTPIANTPVARITLITSRVISFKFPQVFGFIKFAPKGPIEN